ncbi:hypothetical protein OLM89_13370 [Pseudomonas aeruginosa]|uniref:hypothetical protein n=1 Tax=Pseudomonas aeruginosa TaxID=287 RepID=UPI002495F2B8|nr:hypothetical protein [Pseudomonas aeruginosa]MDI2351976.1 hypothetical protein [Pseudomonas aeruginosa]HCF1973508.1 hypothetical protein [Pseudomonas aeruginosa]
MDLFTPQVPEERFHPHFRNIIVDKPSLGYARKVVEAWAEGFPDRDGKFVREFQTTFNSSFWELYLHAALREFGAQIDWNHHSPDFVLSVNGVDFVLEATTANAAKDAVPEWEKSLIPPDEDSLDLNELNRVAIIRLANAFMSKSEYYLERYSKLEHVKGRPFVVAVAPFEQPWFNLQVYRPIEALLFDYYVDEQEFLANPQATGHPEGKSLGFVTKDNGAEIELGFFDCDRFSHISAIVFSSVATWGKVDAMSGYPLQVITTHWEGMDGIRIKVSRGGEIGETITDGLRVYHNPYAAIPLSPDVFRKPGVLQMWVDPERREMTVDIGDADCSLHMRQAWVINPTGDAAEEGLPGEE